MKRAALLLPLVVLVAGCGGADDDDGSRASASGTRTPTPSASATPSPTATASDLPLELPTDPDQRALRTAVTLYSDAFLTGDADVSYALLSRRCRAEVPKKQWDQLLAMAASRYGDALPFTSFEALISGSTARVSYSFADGSIDQTDEPWVLERGGWHDDDC